MTTRRTTFHLLVPALLLAAATPLFAHNKLVATEPEQGAALARSPGYVEITYADAAYLDQLQLATEDGVVVPLDFEPSAEAAASFRVSLPVLAAGRYVVTWTVEGTDTHVLQGELRFCVQVACP